MWFSCCHQHTSLSLLSTAVTVNSWCDWAVQQLSVTNASTYHWDHATGPDAVAHAHSHQALVVRILAPPHQHLVAHEVGLLIDHEEATLHPAGVAPAQVGGELGAVAAGLIGATLEVAVLIEDDL